MLESLLIVVGATFLCMLSPGPDLILVLRNTWIGGRRAGAATCLGILTGNLFHMTYCALGLGWLIVQSVVLYSAVKYAGAAYLLFLGIQGLRARAESQGSVAPVDTEVVDGGTGRRPFAQGLVNNLLNAKGALFYLGIFTQVIEPGAPASEVALLVLAMWTTSALFWVFFVRAVAAGALRDLLERFRVAIERTFGAILIALGVRVAVSD